MRLSTAGSRPVVTEVDDLAELAAGGSLAGVVAQGLRLDEPPFDLASVDVAGAAFLGCRFASAEVEGALVERGALVFGRFADLPYDPYRTRLYDVAELGAPAAEGRTVDEEIFRHFQAAGLVPNVLEALAQRLHDHAIDDALGDLIGETMEERLEKRIVAIMGGHSMHRDDPWFRPTAETARLLSRAGFFVVSGGGPGAMEAANLGAHLANEPDGALDAAIATLAKAPWATDDGYVERAHEVLERHPDGGTSLAIPTWFYGHEPSNLFSPHIAKYFSNSLREDGLLAIALHGIVFAPGSAGTVQEIFQDAAQNRYSSFGWRSPMAFLGRARWDPPQGSVYRALEAEARGNEKTKPEHRYDDVLTLSDEPADLVSFIQRTEPQPKPARGD